MSPVLTGGRTWRLALGLAFMASGAVPDDKPDFSGSWKLSREASDDFAAKVEEAAGPGQVKGAGGREVRFGAGGARSETERVQLRERLLAHIGDVENVTIEQTPTEFKVTHGETFRIFYLDREHVREDEQGRRLRCRSRWNGSQLVIEQTGEDKQDKTRFVEVYTLVPSGDRMVETLRFESQWLKEPLELRLLFARVGQAPARER